ncbi:zinc ribbon domain-containing protein [Lysinibacillus sp. NPDC097162]|uniref:zinc ribbon domain-containing protein n=1 Tax=Lysinibacillus sp. NPDC097162 TaxID=3364140 RepID=UPI003824C0B3
MYCKNCGEHISEHAEICIHCGVRVKNAGGADKPNWGVNIITLCCVPLVGLIMFFVWKNEKPVAAKSALMFFFINIAIIVLFYIAMFIIGLSSY